jgi:hypothetical protein
MFGWDADRERPVRSPTSSLQTGNDIGVIDSRSFDSLLGD